MNSSVRMTIYGMFTVLIVALFASYLKSSEQEEKHGEWVAPASADTLKNPLAGNEKAAEEGKKIYGNLCAICHGTKGKGDGVAGMALNPRPSNFTSGKVQEQSDGALFWKLTEGRPPMASYKEQLTEEQRWQLVNYIRQFEKK